MNEIVKAKTNNPTRLRWDNWFYYKTSKHTTEEYENILMFAPELKPHWFEKELVTTRIYGNNAYVSNNEKNIAGWIFALHKKGIVQGDFSPPDTITDKQGKVWVVDWDKASIEGVQLVDVIGFVHKLDLKQNPKRFKARLWKNKFFQAYLDLCIKEYANQMISKLRDDYKEIQPEQKIFENLIEASK